MGRLRARAHRIGDALRWRCQRAEPFVGAPIWCTTDDPVLWAHAGGGRFHVYGNAQEDIDASIAQGFPVIEVDVSLTSDGVPVLSHRFRPCGQDPYGCVPTVAQFLKTPIGGRFTPLTLAQFVERYQSFPGCFAIDSFSITKSQPNFNFSQFLVKAFPSDVLQRMIYLITGRDCAERLSKGHSFASLHFSVPEWLFSTSGSFCCGAFARYLAAHGIQSASLEVPMDLRQDLARHVTVIRRVVREMSRWGVKASVFGVETVEAVNQWRELGVEIFNVDRLLPCDFNKAGKELCSW